MVDVAGMMSAIVRMLLTGHNPAYYVCLAGTDESLSAELFILWGHQTPQ